jgi:pilus assembly protein Flp/PilA
MEIKVRSYGTRGEGEIFRKRRWNSGEGNDGRARCVNGVWVFMLKFFRQPTEVTTNGSKPGRNHRRKTPRRRDEMFKKLMAMMQNEEGQGLVEYALIIVLVSIVVLVALSLLGTQVSTVFSQITSVLT